MDSLAALFATLPEMCKRHAVVLTSSIETLATRYRQVLQQSVNECTQVGCKICIVVTHPSGFTHHVNDVMCSLGIPVLYMHDPRSQYAIVDLLPTYMRSGTPDIPKLLRFLDRVISDREKVLADTSLISTLLDSIIYQAHRVVDSVVELVRENKLSDASGKLVELRDLTGRLLEVASLILPLRENAHEYISRIQVIYREAERAVQDVEAQVLEARVGLTQLDVEAVVQKLENAVHTLQRCAQSLGDAVLEFSHLTDRELHKRLTSIVKEIVTELKLAAQ